LTSNTAERQSGGIAVALRSEPRPVRRAVILAAGRGSRLHAKTWDAPKCLVEVGGESILERALRALASEGITEALIVVGYKSDVLRARIGARYAGIDIADVDAPDYATTNNLRSLWDARAHLDRDVVLLEADIAFDPGVVATLFAEPGSAAAVAPYDPSLSGTVVRPDASGRVTSFALGSDQGKGFDHSGTFKTVNIYLLRAEALAEIVPRLSAALEARQVDAYYETVFKDCVDEGLIDMAAVDVSGSRWSEIDDDRDLDAAEFLFLDRDLQFDRVQKLHGAYWRYGFVDHSYLYNMHFPPEAMLDVFHGHLREIVTNYPVAQSELARLVSNWTGANPDQLAVANGAAELIKVLGNQFQQRLTIPIPSFNEYEEVIEPAELNRFPLDPVTFELDVDAFAASAIEWRSDTAIVVTPNNPTALSVDRGDILRLATTLAPHNCRLIVDESFVEFSRDGSAGSVEDVVHEHPNLVVIKSMSKVFGVAGIRLGYLLSADQAFINAVRACLPIWNINGLAEDFLRTVGRYRTLFDESCVLTRQACVRFYDDLVALPGIEPVRPDANFILCKLTEPGCTGPDIARRLYVEHNILVKDCAAKSMPDADRFLRIASRTPSENVEFVAALRALLQDDRARVDG
jgi:histidinol-phosphate/aromatic aminotransferase/cobyric acid decarboxylase-like protein/CTP:phosphocholine cytidylyltransferase-like protein